MTIKRSLALLVATSLLLAGCVPLFFAAGAGTGYLATQKEPMKKVDSFFQDLGNSIKQTTRKITGEKQTGKAIAYEAKSGFVLKILKDTIAPDKMSPGEQVQITLRYVIMGAAEKGVLVKEKCTLLSEGKELTVLKTEAATKQNGTWENTLTFAVPESVKPGKFTVEQELRAQGVTRSSKRSFTVSATN